MSRFLTLVCILAIAALISAPAFAEVQNVKVSGDISVRGLFRDNYDLDKNDVGNTTGANISDNTDTYFMQAVGVNVDADLTDNVSTVVRLVSQRDWNDGRQNNPSAANTSAFDVTLDAAYVTLKEMIYAPLTVTIGRQDLWFGQGLIVGANQRNYNSSISATEYTETTGFDAVKATIDLAPWKLDGIYSRLSDRTYTAAASTGRKDLFGANIGYKFDQYNAEAEAYYFGKTDKTLASHTNQVNTYGLRGSLEPIAKLSIGAEGALQRGVYSDAGGINYDKTREIKAYAYDVYGKYNFSDVTWKPTLQLEWLSLSGEKNANTTGESTWHGWDAMYRGSYKTAIRDFQNVYYATRARTGNTSSAWAQDSGLSNQNSLLVTGTVAPMEDVTLKGAYGHFWLNEKPAAGSRGSLSAGDDVGDELDFVLTYDYTQDVSFGLLAGWFFPGNIFPSGQNDTATDVVGTMKVAF